MAENLQSRVGRGVSWSALDQVLQEVLRFGALVILSRLLSPAEFGVVALLTVFTAFVGILADFHVANAVVQRPELTPEFLDTAFWVNVAFGAAAFGTVWCVAPLLAHAYGEPALVDLARVTAGSFLISPLGGVPGGLLLRAIDFRRLAARNVAGTAVTFGTTALLAYRGLGAMSLALGGVAGAATLAALSWLMVNWRPRLRFERAAWRQLVPFSGRLALSSTIGHWSRNLDQFLIGSLAGEHALGLYSRAMMLLLLPLRKIAGRVDAVMFPAMATIQHDTPAMAALYLRATRLVALVTTPLCLGAAVVAPELVRVVFGPGWIEMIPLAQILAPLGALQSILTMGSAIYLARGRSDIDLRVTTWCTLACSLFVLAGLRWDGVRGVAIGYAVFSVAFTPFIYLAAARQIGLGLADQARNLLGSTLCALAMVTLVALARPLVAELVVLARLGVLVALGVAVYLGLLHLFRVSAYREALALAATMRSRFTFPLNRAALP